MGYRDEITYAVLGPFTQRHDARSSSRNRRFLGRARSIDEATAIATQALGQASDRGRAFVQLWELEAGEAQLAGEMTHESRPHWRLEEQYLDAVAASRVNA